MKRGVLFGASSTYDTPLDPAQEQSFQGWANASGKIGDLQDYDLRGAWQVDAQAAANGHLPDTWKKPNHPTFSAESQYSTPQEPGGRWVDDGKGEWQFWSSPANLKYRNATGLMDYFKRAEPDSLLILPSDYRLPAR